MMDIEDSPGDDEHASPDPRPGFRALQDFAYSYRVWITLIKLPYAPLQ